MFPFGLIIMLIDSAKQYVWTTSLFLALQTVILFIILNNAAGIFKSIVLTLIIFISSFLIEYIGVKSGFPFGNYSYSEILIPLLGGVPLAIAFAWFSVTLSSFFLVSKLYGSAGIIPVSFISSALILATDILLEPFASFINGFWIWESRTIYFQNFISWLVIGFIFCIITGLFSGKKIKELNPQTAKIPIIIFSINILTFLVLNAAHGFWLMSAASLFIIIMLTTILPGTVKSEA